MQYFAKGGSSGGHASSGHASSSHASSSHASTSRSSSGSRSSSSSSKSSSSSSKSTSTKAAPPKPVAGKSTAKPGATIKTADGKTVKSSTVKPVNSKYTQSKGVVGDNGYTPRFQGGYTAPAGSVVYYPQHSALDYLPWIYLFSQSSPHNDQATVVQPDNKQVKAEPVGGFDGMLLLNWIIMIVIIIAIIGGIVYLVNKLTNKPKTGLAY